MKYKVIMHKMEQLQQYACILKNKCCEVREELVRFYASAPPKGAKNYQSTILRAIEKRNRTAKKLNYKNH